MSELRPSRDKTEPSRADVKASLAGFERGGLPALVLDLYRASKDNQAFLHGSFAHYGR